MMAANAVKEAKKTNGDFDLPYWRILKAGGYLNQKFPGGIESHKELLEKEGFNVAKKGKRYYVENYHNYLINNFLASLRIKGTISKCCTLSQF